MKRTPRHLHRPPPDPTELAELWSRRWTKIGGVCLLASFVVFLLAERFPSFPPMWSWSDGWSGAWVPAPPRSWREAGAAQHPDLTWRSLVPWLMAVPVLLVARLRDARWRGRLLLLLVLGNLAAVCIPFFGWIELPLGGHDGDGWAIILTGWLVVLGSASVAAGAHVARRHPRGRRGWWISGAGGLAMLCVLLLPVDGTPWILTVVSHPGNCVFAHKLQEDTGNWILVEHRYPHPTWDVQRWILGGWVTAYAVLGLVLLFVRRPWVVLTTRWAGLLFLFAYPISGIVAFRLDPLYVTGGSHSGPETMGWISLVVGSAGNGLLAAGQLILAAVAVGTIAVAGLIPAPDLQRKPRRVAPRRE